MTKVSEADLAWLAGIVDGEGCFSVKRPITRQGAHRPGHRTSYQTWLVICNTSEPMMRRVRSIYDALGVTGAKPRRVWKGKKATRWQHWLEIARKHELLRVTQAILPHLTAKRDEALVVEWFLKRACGVKNYKPTSLDRLALESMAAIKRNGGEAPAEILEILREVIPNQAVSGSHLADGLETEGVETTSVSSNDNPKHECPATALH